MKARLPKGMGGGPQNMQAMLKQAQQMQADIETKKAELEEKEYVVSSGGGMIEVTVTGKREVKAIGINPEVVDPEDVEMLEDLLIAALNEAMRKITLLRNGRPQYSRTLIFCRAAACKIKKIRQ